MGGAPEPSFFAYADETVMEDEPQWPDHRSKVNKTFDGRNHTKLDHDDSQSDIDQSVDLTKFSFGSNEILSEFDQVTKLTLNDFKQIQFKNNIPVILNDIALYLTSENHPLYRQQKVSQKQRELESKLPIDIDKEKEYYMLKQEENKDTLAHLEAKFRLVCANPLEKEDIKLYMTYESL